MNELNKKFLYFKTKEHGFSPVLSLISPDSIVFIEDTKQIYTRNHFFDCQGKATEEELNKWLAKQDLPTKEWVLQILNNIEGGTNTQKEYTAGAGIEINDDQIGLKTASAQEIGGIRVGYVASGNNVPVQLNGLNLAYVHVPNGGGSSNSGKYYEILFKSTDTDMAPTLPTSDSMNGWKTYAENNDGSKIVWMISRLIEGGVANPWEGPWRISGPNGKSGVDGDKIEFIYRLSNSGTTPPQNYDLNIPDPLSNGRNKTEDDFVPIGWTDSPSGISLENKYEWMSMRTKTFSEEKPNGEWSPFMRPVLWSAYGQRGTDGDGVEYIFFTTQSTAPTGHWDPSTWTSDRNPDFQNDEYIRPGYGDINQEPRPNVWCDDPYDLELMSPGAKTYVSMRKRVKVGDVSQWGAYSHPALWAYYAKNGDAGSGVVADFDNDTMCVSLKSNGYNYPFLQTSKIYIYNGVDTVSCTARITKVTYANGNSVENQYLSRFSAAQNSNEITVNIPQDTFNFDNIGSIFVEVEATGTINGETVVRTGVLNIIGVKFGSDGRTYSLKTSTKVIRRNKSGVLSPSTIECFCQETLGSDELDLWKPTTMPARYNDQFRFSYIIDDNLASQSTLVADSISTDGIQDNLVVMLQYKMYDNGDANDWVTVDQETIYVVSDGQETFIPAVHYEIQMLSTTVQKLYNGDNSYLDGILRWKAFKIEGDTRTEITIANSNSLQAVFNVVYGSRTYSTNSFLAGWNNEESCWGLQVHTLYWDDKFAYGRIILEIDGDPKAMIVVPTIMNGKDGAKGESAVLTLEGAVMRLTVWQQDGGTYRDGGVDSVENGIKYLDVVQYGNELYKCIATHEASQAKNPENTTYWSIINTMSDAVFHTMLVNDAYIKNLTAKQIVITNNQDKPVAGVVNSAYYKDKQNDQSAPDNGIRFFAGLPDNTGNLATTAFNVDEVGTVTAGGGKIKLNSDGSGYVANENISWDANGNLTKFKLNPENGGAFTSTAGSMTNCIMITDLIWTVQNVSTSTGLDALKVHGFVFRNGFLYAPIISIIPVGPIAQHGYITQITGSNDYVEGYISASDIANLIASKESLQWMFDSGDSVKVMILTGQVDASEILSPSYEANVNSEFTLRVGARRVRTTIVSDINTTITWPNHD